MSQARTRTLRIDRARCALVMTKAQRRTILFNHASFVGSRSSFKTQPLA